MSDSPTVAAGSSQEGLVAKFRRELKRAVVGQEPLSEQLLIALVMEGHCLFEGVPGSGRFLLVRSVAQALGIKVHRVACTPDLAPEEALAAWQANSIHRATESAVVQSENAGLPHVLYVDEIDRGAPRTQAALLETMTNQRFLLNRTTFATPSPFLVVGAQAVDAHVPRTLTSSQRDRFLFGLAVHSPSYDEEYRIAAGNLAAPESLGVVAGPDDLRGLAADLDRIESPPPVLHYALRLVRGTRVHEGEHHDFVYEWLSVGAGPRAAQLLIATARVRARLRDRSQIESDDLRALAHPVLRHRLELNHNALSRGVTVDDAIKRLLEETPEREDGDERVPRLFRTRTVEVDEGGSAAG